MNKRSTTERDDRLYEAIAGITDPAECKKFFIDLCTRTELIAMEQRFNVAACLNRGMIYNDILAETGASSATISRVNRALLEGEGYRAYFDRLEEEEQ